MATDRLLTQARNEMMAKKKTRYVTLTRDRRGYGWYDLWPGKVSVYMRPPDSVWEGTDHKSSLDNFCPTLWHMHTGLVLRKGTKRRVKITYLKNGVKWEWAGKAKE